jgi:hypothetical protein
VLIFPLSLENLEQEGMKADVSLIESLVHATGEAVNRYAAATDKESGQERLTYVKEVQSSGIDVNHHLVGIGFRCREVMIERDFGRVGQILDYVSSHDEQLCVEK